ncbi:MULTISPECIES: hypothetical protein [Ectothiorhodospira]|uniref:Uncharacterized protein n=1 Tax=Ectothiorhodospira marina TaxID=1396821 RepID=A0A1H7MFR9_9GAMM|nr:MULTISPECIES: hypothetical protein [Ectothiorhodospira]MCG5514629.1 hypothetical protein [Ectothiorhodospira sp. 9100]MCG5517997.1 hypothetical protein [Ectothiorhodospira sp. 9905]SEL09994.1 hypothetical protein SAMN05444515_10984 [Ectothiorhodospira marina]
MTRRKKTDTGLVVIGLLLLGVGGFALFGGEVWISRLTVGEGQGIGGTAALVIGGIFIGLGLYFLKESRK